MPALLKAKGLQTYGNELNLDEGALVRADNIVINKDDVINPRHGFKEYGDHLTQYTDRHKQLMTYKDLIFRHFDSNIQYDNGSGTFTNFTGSYEELETGLRIKYIEANGNFFFTTNDGIKKISASSASEITTGSIVNAGGAKALHIESSINSTISGFLSEQSKCAYRSLWGYKDNNQNLIFGSPSERKIVTNTDVTVDDAVMTTGSGIDDLTSGGFYTGSTTQEFTVKIDATGTPDTFEWAIDGVVYESGVEITGGTQTLIDGVEISFELTTGHTLNDVWTFEVTSVAKEVTLTFNLPNEVDSTEYFYQVYRTQLIQVGTGQELSDLNPGDEMNLVYEKAITTDDITLGEVSFTDNTPESFRTSGVPLYTNPVSGDGILQANEKPPVAKDIATFKESTFYANTRTINRKQISMLSVLNLTHTDPTFTGTGANDLIVGGIFNIETSTDYVVEIDGTGTPDTFRWSDDGGSTWDASTVAITGLEQTLNNGMTITFNETTGHVVGDKWEFTADPTYFYIGDDQKLTTYMFTATTDLVNNKVAVSNETSVSISIDETARELIRVINRDSDGLVYGYYMSGQDDLPGIILFESRNLGDGQFYIGTTPSTASDFSPTMDSAAEITDISTSSVVTTLTDHGYTTGDSAYINCLTSNPQLSGIYTVTTLTPTTFSITTTISVAGTNGTTYLSSVHSDNEISPNRVYFSKTSQPEAVPRLNYLDIGPKDQEIKRILALRDNLFVLKEDGIYIISGTSASNFTVRLSEYTAVEAPDAAVVLNNQIYALTSQGVATISDTGVGIISHNIEDQITSVTSPRTLHYKTAAFGLAYDSDRAYHIWLPSKNSDTAATQCFRYNINERNWVRWDVSATCALVNPSDDKLYIAPSDQAFLTQERKNGDRTDYADLEYSKSCAEGAISDKTIQLNNLDHTKVGDVLLQTQWVTIARFNRLLRKLDLDIGLEDDPVVEAAAMVEGSGLDDLTSGGIYTGTTATELYKVKIDNSTLTYATLLANELKLKFNQHCSDALAHTTATDSTNLITEADATDEETLVTLVTQLLVNYEAHDGDAELAANWLYHEAQEASDNSLTTTEAPTDLAESLLRLADLKTKYNAHDNDDDSHGLASSNQASSADTFKWCLDGEERELEVEITGSAQTLSQGVTVTFGTTTGHTDGDAWEFNAIPPTLFTSLEASAGDSVYDKLDALIARVDEYDTGLTYTSTNPTTFEECKDEWNYIINQLNSISSSSNYRDYALIGDDETVDYETIIMETDLVFNKVTTELVVPFWVGPFTLFKGYETVIEWAPQDFGDPTVLKQIHEGSIVFDGNQFTYAYLGYASDTSGAFDEIFFNGQGTGTWGVPAYGTFVWGGEGDDKPFRTLIPRGMQRCRYISTRFRHLAAREFYDILGMTLSMRSLSTRAYRKIGE